MKRRIVCIGVLLVTLLLFAGSASAASALPIGEWPLDEGEGQIVTDVSGQGHHGFRGDVSNPDSYDPTWRSGSACYSENCLEFYGSEYVRIPYDGTFESEEITMGAWVWIDDYNYGGDGAIYQREQAYKIHLKGADTDYPGAVAVATWHGDKWLWDAAKGKAGGRFNYRVPTDTWTHIAVSWDGYNYDLYVNGEHRETLHKRDSYTPIDSQGTEDLAIGVRDIDGATAYGPLYWFEGRLQGIQHYDEPVNPDPPEVDNRPPQTTDDYYDSDWKNTAQNIDITCQDDDSGCAQIDWRITDSSGNTLRPNYGGYYSESSNSVSTIVGQNYNGALYLEYRGIDEEGNIESWNNQRVRIDKINPDTEITGPDDDQWYQNDFTATFDDSNPGPSGYNYCQYRVIDGSNTGSWQTRSCGSDGVTITVGENGECSVEGEDACTIETRVGDNAGNTDTDSRSYDIDYSGPEIRDNYTDDGWKNVSQPVKLECVGGTDKCWDIDWRIIKDGEVVRSDIGRPPRRSMVVNVGSENNGRLVLEYRGDSPPGKGITGQWESQVVKVDKVDPETEITGPDPDIFYDDDITVSVRDSDEHSGIRLLDVKYAVDVSSSFTQEWDTLETHVEQIEDDVEDDEATRMSYEVLINNNSYSDHGGNDFHCMPGQESPRGSMGQSSDDINCVDYRDFVSDVTDVGPYLEFLRNDGVNVGVSSYDPSDRGEAPSEGWGISFLDLIENGNWDSGATEALIAVGDQDANGGGPCGDQTSWDLTYYLQNRIQQENMQVFGMNADDNNECSSEHFNQLNELGQAYEYGNTDQLVNSIKQALQGIDSGRCHYRINDAGSGWTEWKSRDCPDGSFTVDVGEPNTGADCTVPGEDQCQVQVRVFDIAGNVAYDTETFDISQAIFNDTPDFDTEVNPPDLGSTHSGSSSDDEGGDLSYTAFITTSEHPDLLPIKVSNNGGHPQTFVTSIEGEGFTLQGGGKQTEEYTLQPGQTEEFLVQVGTEEGDRKLRVTTESKTLSIADTETIDVHVRDHQVRTDREVPGLESLHIAVLTAVSTVAYSLLL